MLSIGFIKSLIDSHAKSLEPHNVTTNCVSQSTVEYNIRVVKKQNPPDSPKNVLPILVDIPDH